MGRIIRARDTYAEDGWGVTQSYGNNPAYYSQFNLLFHEGVDLAKQGAEVPIRAVCNGLIIQDFDNPTGRNYGVSIVVWDDKQGCAWGHNHMTRNVMNYGDRVKAGQIIGYQGSTGNSTGRHDHLNFMLVDERGVKKYNTKAQNWGYLDPQYPRDFGTPVQLPNVEDYKVEWYTGDSITISDTTMIDPMIQKKASRCDDILIDEFGKEIDTNKIDDDSFARFRKSLMDRKVGNGQIDVVLNYIGTSVEDKAHAAQAIVNHIGGVKGSLTDCQNKLTDALGQLKSREEQVSNLRQEMTIISQANTELHNAMVDMQSGTGGALQVARDQATKLQRLLDEKGKQLGDKDRELEALTKSLNNANKKIDTLTKQGISSLTVVEILTIAIKKLSKK